MEEKQLRIFVSGKEDELFNERIIANKVIKSFEYIPEGSENRSASNGSIKSEYLGEVRVSHIYIGIFGTKYSEPTIQEFTVARENHMPPLIFIRNLRDGEQRDPKLKGFLEKIKEHETGISYKLFTNVIDLEDEISKALSKLLAKRFTKHDDLLKENEELKSSPHEKMSTTATTSEIMKLKNMDPFIVPPKDIGVRLSEEYGKAQIIDFKIPSVIKNSESFISSAMIVGTTSNGFLDIVFVTPTGSKYWFPDLAMWSPITDNGSLNLVNGRYTANITCNLEGAPQGMYRAVMGLYENNPKNRRLVHYVEKEILIE